MLKRLFVILLSLLVMIGTSFSVGFHNADEIIAGTFMGDFNYNGDLYVSNSKSIFFGGNTLGINSNRLYTTTGSDRLYVRAVDTDNVAQFAQYGLFLPKDVGTGLYVSGGARINYNDAGKEFIVTNTGNVGIGTLTPAVKLDVAGTIRANQICDESGANCKDISTGWAGGKWVSSGSNIYYNLGSVGIGTTSPSAKLHVNGGQIKISSGAPQILFDDSVGDNYWIHNNDNRLYFLWDELDDGDWDPPYPLYLEGRDAYFGDDVYTKVIKKVNDGAPTSYYKTSKRYHVEATKARVRNTVPLDMSIVNDLCKDDDGCSITIGMKDWENSQPGNIASRGPYRLYLSQNSRWWRTSNTDWAGNDANGAVNHILQAWDCYFTDGEYVNGAGSDSSVGFGLLNWVQTYNDPDMVCILDIED